MLIIPSLALFFSLRLYVIMHLRMFLISLSVEKKKKTSGCPFKRTIGLRRSLDIDLIFSSLPCARNNPCSSFQGVSFLSGSFLWRVCWLHLNSQHSTCNSSFSDITSQFLLTFSCC